jgi:hypothetical protein
VLELLALSELLVALAPPCPEPALEVAPPSASTTTVSPQADAAAAATTVTASTAGIESFPRPGEGPRFGIIERGYRRASCPATSARRRKTQSSARGPDPPEPEKLERVTLATSNAGAKRSATRSDVKPTVPKGAASPSAWTLRTR